MKCRFSRKCKKYNSSSLCCNDDFLARNYYSITRSNGLSHPIKCYEKMLKNSNLKAKKYARKRTPMFIDDERKRKEIVLTPSLSQLVEEKQSKSSEDLDISEGNHEDPEMFFGPVRIKGKKYYLLEKD